MSFAMEKKEWTKQELVDQLKPMCKYRDKWVWFTTMNLIGCNSLSKNQNFGVAYFHKSGSIFTNHSQEWSP